MRWQHGTREDLEVRHWRKFINHSNERYSEMGLALMQKIPTPITPVRMDKDHRQITLAYFDKASTVDYIGAVQGIPVCFDAKECNVDTFPLQNVHEHQMDFMEKFERQADAFFLIYYTARNELYYMQYTQIRKFWDRAQSGGRKSVRLEELDPEWIFSTEEWLFCAVFGFNSERFGNEGLTESYKVRIITNRF